MLVKISHELCYSELMAVATEIEGTRAAGIEQASIERITQGEQSLRPISQVGLEKLDIGVQQLIP